MPQAFKSIIYAYPSTMIDFITQHRGIFVTIFVLPVSLLFKYSMQIRNRIIFWMNSAPDKHPQKVTAVQQQVKNWALQTKRSIPMCTARPGWQAMSLKQGNYKKTHFKINTHLPDILEINQQKGTVRVEPMVNMAQITAMLAPLGWTLAVVPELDSLTVGGLINGFGIESSSHKYGLFQYICESFELVTANGELKTCSKEENSELYYAIPWSHGSLGFLVSAEIKIIPAQKYVHLRYIPYQSREEFIRRFSEESLKPFNEAHDFVEGLMYTKDQGVLMLGDFANEIPAGQRKNAINHFWKPWFYEHARSFLKHGQAEEWIPLRHYYHRHTRSLFWEMQQIIPFANHPLFRYLLGWMSPPEISLLKLTETQKIHELYDKHHMDQDILVPVSTLAKTLDFIDQEIDLYPLWLCPCKLFSTPIKGMVGPAGKEEMFVDVGIYGEPRIENYQARETVRILEAFVRGVKGYQALYADTYQTRAELRQMFDHGLLDKLRKQYNALDAFPEPFDKVSRKART